MALWASGPLGLALAAGLAACVVEPGLGADDDAPGADSDKNPDTGGDDDDALAPSRAGLTAAPHPKFGPAATAQLFAFGFERMMLKTGMGAAAGNPPAPREVPLMRIMADVNCGGGFSSAAFARQPQQAYDDLLFLESWPGRSARSAFREMSAGRFTFKHGPSANVCVPYASSFAWDQAAGAAIGAAPLDLRPYDLNGDGKIRHHELTVIVFADFPGDCGANRWPGPNECVDVAYGMKVCGSVVIVNSGAGLATVVHELSHTLGADDLYGSDSRQQAGVDVMGPTCGGGPTNTSVHLGAWHKLELGWTRPDVIDMKAAPIGKKTLYCGQSDRAELDGTLLFWNSGRGLDDYFLVEARCRAGFDDGLGDPAGGLAVWDVELTPTHDQRTGYKRFSSVSQRDCLPWANGSLCDTPSVCMNDVTSVDNKDACWTNRLLHFGDNDFGQGWADLRHADGSVEPTRVRVLENVVEGGQVVGFVVEWFTGGNPPHYPPPPPPPPPPSLGAPIDVAALAVSDDTAKVSWKPGPGLPPENFDIETGDPWVVPWGGANLSAKATSKEIWFLTGRTNRFRVCAKRKDSARVCSAEVWETNPPTPTSPPLPPTCPPGMALCLNGCQKPNKCMLPQ